MLLPNDQFFLIFWKFFLLSLDKNTQKYQKTLLEQLLMNLP